MLDIKSAFNSVRRTDILRLLEELGVKNYLLGLIDEYLWYRSIILHDGERYFNVEFPQGSCLARFSAWLL